MNLHQKQNCVSDTRPNHCNAFIRYHCTQDQRGERRALLAMSSCPFSTCHYARSSVATTSTAPAPPSSLPFVPISFSPRFSVASDEHCPSTPASLPASSSPMPCLRNSAWRATSTAPAPPPGSEPLQHLCYYQDSAWRRELAPAPPPGSSPFIPMPFLKIQRNEQALPQHLCRPPALQPLCV